MHKVTPATMLTKIHHKVLYVTKIFATKTIRESLLKNGVRIFMNKISQGRLYHIGIQLQKSFKIE